MSLGLHAVDAVAPRRARRSPALRVSLEQRHLIWMRLRGCHGAVRTDCINQRAEMFGQIGILLQLQREYMTNAVAICEGLLFTFLSENFLYPATERTRKERKRFFTYRLKLSTDNIASIYNPRHTRLL